MKRAPVVLETLLDECAASTDPYEARGPLVGECLDAAHPTLRGRVLVEVPGSVDRWVATLAGVAVRAGDRLLMTRPENWPEWIVVGVVDGFARRPELPKTEAAALRIERDECIRLHGHDGRPLIAIRQGDGGPVVTLEGGDVDLEIQGGLRISASEISLAARRGAVLVDAAEDVIVTGETIQLN